ncbi:hypothetical protein RBB68_11910 [Leptospira interrogans]|uniref:hypothetical protein n=1 Tax=Leptospira interrogans TaxID=173 RepID=UPI0002981553|nr:hypothetical protein [Leptospira interrogans]APH42189.1 Uncharacterized protein A9P81_2545 [Leptospira interrogans serovar Copenhageni/Icterohaemorrhagiae]EKP74883.1 hypothetical protein LEP1GSC173_0992 [Leptospira interrogans str. HAI1594]OCC30606.1 Uncharacterized protein GNX_0867 [Leptospira interrogans serovar Canicola]KPA25179.1 Uncharacterized protein AMR48_3037 [Leptospira interrogans]KPA35096.1 Uncharacterized protein AMR50_0008 [Leptospira interrogans]
MKWSIEAGLLVVAMEFLNNSIQVSHISVLGDFYKIDYRYNFYRKNTVSMQNISFK